MYTRKDGKIIRENFDSSETKPKPNHKKLYITLAVIALLILVYIIYKMFLFKNKESFGVKIHR
jgi:cell division protein FtsL